MELDAAVDRLAALAQGARLRVFRLLVRAGPDGLAAGAIADQLDMAPQTLSFHLRHLASAGLIESRREGRSLVYRLVTDGMRELLAFLSEDCCQGRRELCVPVGRPPRTRRRKEERTSVLFLCWENSARSQMAEALLRDRAGDRFAVRSAGLHPTDVHPMTLRVLDEIGIDTASCAAKDIGGFLGRIPIDHCVVVCERARRECAQIHPFARRRFYWPIEDPAVPDASDRVLLARFRSARDAIRARIEEWLDEIDSSPPASAH